METISENIALVREKIAEAAKAAGRHPEEITLVGASKMNNAAACRAAIDAGIDALGENRVQEMTEKLAQNAYDGVPLHFIGHLQRNKLRQVVGIVSLIQSGGSEELLLGIDHQAEKCGIQQDVLLEVNIGEEESKSGFLPAALLPAAEKARSFSHIRVLGLMAIPPANASFEENCAYFEKVYTLYLDINEKIYDNRLSVLSMGMSGDFQQAIRFGATMVRVGSAIFGEREYPRKAALLS